MATGHDVEICWKICNGNYFLGDASFQIEDTRKLQKTAPVFPPKLANNSIMYFEVLL